ncbi:hypothetical protein [Gemmatimonas sp.]|uniref:hypothetical protein n=1 Tax=Gemmatimonas sp. TaxID=1962908 RepID=UPI00356474D3
MLFLSDIDADNIIRELGKTPAPTPRRGVRTAMEFFGRYLPHLDRRHQLSYLKAMDLSKPVARVDLLRGEEVAAFRYHLADFGEFHARVGANPARLGVLLRGRQFRRFEVVQRVAALSSYTGAFQQLQLGSGGAEQLIIPGAPLVLRVTQRGIETR